MFYFAFSFALLNDIKLRNIFNAESYKNTNPKRIVGAVGLGLSISALISGGLFKLQFWPGANLNLITGLIAMGSILMVAAFFYFRTKADFYKGVFKRIAIYGVFGLALLLTSSSTLVDIYHRDNPKYAELYKKVIANPDDMELRKQLEQMQEEMLRKELDEAYEKNK